MMRQFRERFFRPKPQAPAVVRQMLPINVRPSERATPRPIGRHSRPEDLVEIIGPGQFRIRIPRDREPDLFRTPFDVAHEITMDRLLHEGIEGTLSWPDQMTVVKQPMTREERQAERISVIRRLATGPIEFRQMLDNEALPQVPWIEPTKEEREERLTARIARELRGLLRLVPWRS